MLNNDPGFSLLSNPIVPCKAQLMNTRPSEFVVPYFEHLIGHIVSIHYD